MYIGLALFVGAIAFNLQMNSSNNQASNLTLRDIEALTALAEEQSQLLCEASVDCDLVGGDGYVKCYGYDPRYSCYTYPALGKVKCDGREHFCKIIPLDL